jgi:hypothetical protein
LLQKDTLKKRNYTMLIFNDFSYTCVRKVQNKFDKTVSINKFYFKKFNLIFNLIFFQ